MSGGENAEWTCLDEDATRGLVTNPADISYEESRQEAKEQTFLCGDIIKIFLLVWQPSAPPDLMNLI